MSGLFASIAVDLINRFVLIWQEFAQSIMLKLSGMI